MPNERRLRVAITARAVAPWHGRGGLERHVRDLVTHLAQAGARVTLIVPPPRHGAEPDDHSQEEDGVDTVHVPYVTFPGAGRRGTTILDRDTAYPLFGWRAGREAVRLARAGRLDVVHGLGASVLGYAAACERDRRLPPFVFNPQGLEEFGATDPRAAGLKVRAYWPLQVIVRRCAREAAVVLATDRSLTPFVLQHLRIPADRVAVIPNAVDIVRCDRLAGPEDGLIARANQAWPESTIVFVSVGRLERNKGFHVMLDALTRLEGAESNWRWVLLGAGPFARTFDELVLKAGLSSRVTRVSHASDPELHAWYEAADVFVHPTLYEGSSLVTLEAMAHRRPVLATRAGGLPDKVVPGVTGWLVEPGSADALAAGLRDAADARSRWREMGAGGRSLAEKSFAWPRIADDLIQLYRDVIPSS
ncbi:MAG: glycosyltransferase family 4 protein [Vicinamibacterales bacterium]